MKDKIFVKVCGMRDGDNIRALEKVDVDWMGFIFYQGSPRYVPDDDIFTEAIQSCTKIKAGVFVNEEPEEIERKVAKYRLDYVQLHGDELPDCCRRLKDAGRSVIKAFSVSADTDFRLTAAYEPFVKYFLFDAPPSILRERNNGVPAAELFSSSTGAVASDAWRKKSNYGGTGRRFDWSVLAAYKGNTPFLLSGGIGAEHIAELAAFHHPLMAGIDLNSRFETSPALKDTDKIRRFVRRLRNFY
jgi:phosphoribosylanthranilate isomerase